jgi:hypothetical protein
LPPGHEKRCPAAPVANKYEFIDDMRFGTEEYAYSFEFMCG